jgi:hypothetical protein
MGPHTRRNFRYYRRQFERQGHEYVGALTVPEFRAAAVELSGRTSVPAKSEHIERNTRTCSSAERPILMGLRACSGEWLAVLGGWYDREEPTVYFQMNRDEQHRTESLSVVLRGYLIEELIQRGFQRLVFVHGVMEPLSRYCHTVPRISLYLDKPHGVLSPAPFLGLVARLVPADHVQDAAWIANLSRKSICHGTEP